MDEQLAQQLQAGQLSALAPLVERHHRPLMGFLYHALNGDAMLAEDLVQETFIRMLRAIQSYQYPRPFKPWLYAIASNLLRDHYKRADTRHTLPMPEEAESFIADDEAPADPLPDLSPYLTRLPDHQREVLLLRYYQEMPLQEIAEALEIPLGTVKSRISLGLRQLRTWMLEEEVYERV